MEVYPTPDNLKHRLEEIARTVVPALTERKYELHAMLEEADFVIETDWAALSNAVKHILLGAASASAGGVLELSVSGADPDFCTIRITAPSGAAGRRPVEPLFAIFHDDKDASTDRTSVVQGNGVALRRDPGGTRNIKNKS